MSRRLPRMEVIEAFIEAAHAPSFRVAAERCALSPGAFSRRIQAFAAYVGQDIFERRDGRLRLTDAGRDCVAQLESVYREMGRAVTAIGRASPSARDVVVVSLSHSLAVSWLISRLDQFRSSHPGIDIELLTDRTAAPVRSGDSDIGICVTDVDATGLTVARLLDIAVTPVGRPHAATLFRSGVGRFADHKLLKSTQHPDLWGWWAADTGFAEVLGPSGPSFDVLNAMYEAAAAGHGIALGASITVEPYLRSGRLVLLGLPSAIHPWSYRLVGAAQRLRSPSVGKVWRWLLEQANTGQAGTDLLAASQRHGGSGQSKRLATA